VLRGGGRNAGAWPEITETFRISCRCNQGFSMVAVWDF